MNSHRPLPRLQELCADPGPEPRGLELLRPVTRAGNAGAPTGGKESSTRPSLSWKRGPAQVSLQRLVIHRCSGFFLVASNVLHAIQYQGQQRQIRAHTTTYIGFSVKGCPCCKHHGTLLCFRHSTSWMTASLSQFSEC